jgi:hypothetical protein
MPLMVRSLLAMWYALTVLLGPALCCCATRPAHAEARPVADAPAPAKKGCCCCPTEAESPEARPEPAAPKPEHPPGGCPCKKFDRQDQDRPGPASGETSAQPRSFDLPLADPLASALTAVAGGTNRHRAELPGGPAGLFGRDLLTAYHILRC